MQSVNIGLETETVPENLPVFPPLQPSSYVFHSVKRNPGLVDCNVVAE